MTDIFINIYQMVQNKGKKKQNKNKIQTSIIRINPIEWLEKPTNQQASERVSWYQALKREQFILFLYLWLRYTTVAAYHSSLTIGGKKKKGEKKEAKKECVRYFIYDFFFAQDSLAWM